MAAAVHPPRMVHQDTPTSSPKDVKKSLMKQEDASRHASPHQSAQGSRQNSPPQPVQPPEAASTNGASTEKETSTTTNAQPLGPPPKPSTSGPDLDYFSGQHGTAFQVEANPFEASFGASSDTPGKSLLPPVASLTSPSTLLPGGTPGWPDSLRSGPLSPAMLPGPSGATDYFGQSFRGSFPTPNESSLRTGLTPGGGGSMFPAPSPNSQLLGLLSGGVTPGFSDFHRTAMNAAAKQNHNNVTSNAQTSHNDSANQFAQEEATPARNMPNTSQASDPFGQSTANEAANGLYMLTQAATSRNGNYGMHNQPSNLQTNAGMIGGQSQETSPLTRRGNNKASIGSMNSGSVTGMGSESGESEQTKPTTRSRGGRKGASANGKTANNRRKAEDTPAKAPATKKARANSGGAMQLDAMMDDDDDDDMGNMDLDANGKKMTDEEKRKNFLERNRVAALKCRQRKKQWLQNLQNKVEIYSAENDALSGQVQGLREEIVNLKTLLLAHKDCPVASSQGLQGVNMHQFLEQNSHQHANPYGLGMPNGMPMQGMGMGPGPMQQTQRT